MLCGIIESIRVLCMSSFTFHKLFLQSSQLFVLSVRLGFLDSYGMFFMKRYGHF